MTPVTMLKTFNLLHISEHPFKPEALNMILLLSESDLRSVSDMVKKKKQPMIGHLCLLNGSSLKKGQLLPILRRIIQQRL